MDLRNLPDNLTSLDRCNARREIIENELGIRLNAVETCARKLGHGEEKNCEQMFGHVGIPVGHAGPLNITFSGGKNTNVHLPLATTEGALVASINRGCSALNLAGGVQTSHEHIGISRSICLKIQNSEFKIQNWIKDNSAQWKEVGEATSNHLKVLNYTVDERDEYVFLTIECDTDEAMGMNMVTVASQAIGEHIVETFCRDVASQRLNDTNIDPIQFITVAGNIDSDKKPSQRTHDRGRGYRIRAEAMISEQVITEKLKTTPEAMLEVAHAKLELGSTIAGALGHNLHAANTIAAMYLATGQDATHTVEGSLCDTIIRRSGDSEIAITVDCPAIIVGVRGGGTTLPSQKECLEMLLHEKTSLHPCAQLAESIGAVVLAGELSLLAAQAAHHLTKAHKELGR